MAKYAVTYQEVLARTVIVEADDYDETADKMMDAVDRGEIELTLDDYLLRKFVSQRLWMSIGLIVWSSGSPGKGF